MGDNHVGENSSTVKDEEFPPLGSIYGAAAESSGDSVDKVDPSDSTDRNSLHSLVKDQNDPKPAEDGARDDMFVDCPDEIENSESHQSSEEKGTLQDDHLNESDSGINVNHLMTEIEHLRDAYEKSLAEKERSAREYEEERAGLMREFGHLCHKLKVLSKQQTSPDENADGAADHLQSEAGVWDLKTSASDASGASLHDMISECSRLVNTLGEHLNTEEKVRELNSVLHMKDQEIEFLNAKAAELYESGHIFESNLSQLHESQLHIDETVNRMLTSLSTNLHQEELLNSSLTEKVLNVEKSVTSLVEKYNLFLLETEQLRGCLTEVGLDVNVMDEVQTIALARDTFLELRSKEDNLYQNLSHLEDENRKLVEQLQKQRSISETATADIERLRAEVEQEKKRCANTKEKLSMAVTKGKGLVQQRDSLKQSLAEKTSQLEKSLIELQEKSSALEAAEKTKELVAESENFAASLQESLADKDTILQKCAEILSEVVVMEELQPTDIVERLRWLADQEKSLKAISLKYDKMTEALLSFDFPETVASSELDTLILWLVDSFSSSKEAQERLQHELEEAREAANNEIDRLTKSLVAESQDKNYLHVELEDLRLKHDGIVQKEYHVSLEKDQIVNMLLEASGLTNDGHKEPFAEHSHMATVIDNCLAKIKEKTSRPESSQVDSEIFETFQSLLYTRDQEARLYELIVEEDILDRGEVKNLSNQLRILTQKLDTLKDEKAVMQESFEQLEDRCSLLKDKLSMAVKKGKGLVQERENLKGALNEKNSEIDRLKSELQKSLSTCDELQEKITTLLLDVERISQLETDHVATKEHVDQLEQFLTDSNSMLQRVMESIEDISAPADLIFNEPVEKVKWLSRCLTEHEISKMEMEQELRNAKDEASSLASKLAETQTASKSLEDAIAVAENNVSQLLDEKKELEVSKALLEEEFQKEKEEASSHLIKFEEVSVSQRALEDALSLAENNISRFMNERDIAVESRALAEEQLLKLKEEFSNQINKLADADKTIQLLEDALSEAQKNVSVLTEENSKVQTGTSELDNEIKQLREEADSQASKLSNASLTIKSLEDALLNAENNMEDLVQEKKIAEQEILELSSKLEYCMEELAGTRGSIENRSMELSGKLTRLKLLLKDESLLSSVDQCFGKNIESLKKMDVVLNEMRDCFLEMEEDVLQDNPIVEGDSTISTTLPSNPGMDLNMEMLNDEVNAVDGESIMFNIEKMCERFDLKSKILTNKLDKFSTLMDECVAALLRRLHVTKDRMKSSMNNIKSLKQQVKDMEIDKQRQEETIASLESDTRILSSACTDATQGLCLNGEKSISELRSIHELVKFDDRMFMELAAFRGEAATAHTGDHVKTAETLLLATRHHQDLSDLFQVAINNLLSTMENMQNKLKEIELTSNEVPEERDLHKETNLKLETDLEEQRSLCKELTLKLDDYQEIEKNLEKREEERDFFKEGLSKLEMDLEEQRNLCKELKLKLDEYQEIEKNLVQREEERDSYQEVMLKLEADLEAQRDLCKELTLKLDEYREIEENLKKREEERDFYQERMLKLEADLEAQGNLSKELTLKQEDYREIEENLRRREEESDVNKDRILKLETDLEEQRNFCKELTLKLDDYQEKEDNLKKKVSELSTSLSKVQEFEDFPLSASQVKSVLKKINEVEIPDGAVTVGEPRDMTDVRKLFYVIEGFTESLRKISLLSHENEELQSTIDEQILEIELLRKKIEDHKHDKKDSQMMLELEAGLQNIVRKLGGNDLMDDQKAAAPLLLMPLLDKLVMTTIFESGNLKSKNEELVTKLLGSQKVVGDLSNKVKLLEDSNQGRIVLAEADQDRGTSIASLSSQSEISEIQDIPALATSSNIPAVPSAAHPRSLRKGSSDHLAINVDSESERLINNKEPDEDKGHMFKSLNTSGLIPRQGRAVADRVDGIWVSGSRALMNHPRGRLGLIAYCLLLHIWLLGTIL